MNDPHSRRLSTIPKLAAASIPESQAKALDRRHTLDAQQRTFRHTTSRYDRPHPGPRKHV